MEHPKRRSLPHAPPPFVSAGEIFFLTICGDRRGQNQFANDLAWSDLRAAAEHYHRNNRWHLRLLLAMPDHLHALASFARADDMKRVINAWKHYLARTARFVWQRDFFDHRLRGHENLDEKSFYIRMNPVRAGLVARAEDWPYAWRPDDVVATPIR